MNTGISRFVIRFPEKIALLEGLMYIPLIHSVLPSLRSVRTPFL